MHPLSLALLLLWPLGCSHAQSTGPPPNRRGASVQWNNTWYIQGGFSSRYLKTFHSLDLSTSWSTALPPWTTHANGAFGSHAALVATSDGRIWSVGGNPKSALLSFVANEGRWSPLAARIPSYPQGIEGHAALVVPNDSKIYIVGGFSTKAGVLGSNFDGTANLITVFDMITNSFVPPGPTQAQVGMTSWNDMGWAWLSKKQMALFFGGTRSPPGNSTVPVPIGELQQFVPWRNEWSSLKTTGTGPSPRLDHCMAANADGTRVVVFGGTDGTNFLDDIYILDTESNQWSQGPPAVQPRTRMVCTIHSNQLIAWGGSYGSQSPKTLHNATPIIFNLDTGSWVTKFTPSMADNGPGAGNDISKDLPIPPSYDPSNESGVPLGAIIGGAVGGVLLLALVGFLLFRRTRRQREASVKTTKAPPESNDHLEPLMDLSGFPSQHTSSEIDSVGTLWSNPKHPQSVYKGIPPPINRATRPAAAPFSTSPDMALEPTGGSGASRVVSSTDVSPSDHRPSSIIPGNADGSSRTGGSPQYIPPSSESHSQTFGLPQIYLAGQHADSHSSPHLYGGGGGADGAFKESSPSSLGYSHPLLPQDNHPHSVLNYDPQVDYIPPPPTSK